MEEPRINILIRTANRPNYFKDCIKSVLRQDYDNISVVVHFDNPESLDYIETHSNDILKRFPDSELIYSQRQKRRTDLIRKINGNICYHAPYNLYLNKMYDACKEGFIMFLDDDDMFTTESSVSEIAKHCLTDKGKLANNRFLNWIVNAGGREIPSEKGKGKIIAGDIGGSIAFPVVKKHLAVWDDFSFGDFRIISKLAQECELVFIDKVLTMTQNRESTGNFGRAVDKKN